MRTFLKFMLYGIAGVIVLGVIASFFNKSNPQPELQGITTPVDSTEQKEQAIYAAYQAALRESGNPRSFTITPITDCSTPTDAECSGANIWEMKQADKVVAMFSLSSREALYAIAKKVGMKAQKKP